MRVKARDEEYTREGNGMRHGPTGIHVSLAYQNVRGDWTVSYLKGNLVGYDESDVVSLGAYLMLGY